MKTYLLHSILFLLVAVSNLCAQTKLPDSLRHSPVFRVYQISPENLHKICVKNKSITEDMLGQFVEESPRGAAMPKLPRGNYIIVSSEGEQLVFIGYNVDNFYFQLI